MIIDSHCHLLASRYDIPVNEVIENCFAENISLLLNIATKESEFNEILDISRKYKRIYNSIGIHPHETEHLDPGIFDRINKVILENNKTIAVGETGLDFYYNHSNKKSQIDSFEKHIEKALEHNLPIIVHSREAEKVTKEILYSSNERIKSNYLWEKIRIKDSEELNNFYKKQNYLMSRDINASTYSLRSKR